MEHVAHGTMQSSVLVRIKSESEPKNDTAAASA